MARTTTHSDTSFSPKRVPSASFSGEGGQTPESPEPRRSKRSISRIDVPVSAPVSRKRVNQESLAARLGPELIKELGALLQPGMTEMPPFAVRQTLQKRYNINRRHIYDWFHSKGLRVTKDDTRATGEGQSGWMRPQKVRRYHAPTPMSTPDVGSYKYNDNVQTHSLDLVSPTPLGAYIDQVGSFQDKQSIAIGSTADVLYPLPVEGHEFQGNLSSFVNQIDPNVATNDHVEDLSVVSGSSSSVDEDDLACDPNIPASASSGPPSPVHVLNSFKDNIDPLLSLDYQGLLSGSERQAVYEGLSGVLGPANGIQESVGTYKTFMLKQRQTYYERLIPTELTLSLSHRTSETGPSSNCAAASVSKSLSVSQPDLAGGPHIEPHNSLNRSEASISSPAVSDFQGFLLGGRSYPNSIVSSRTQTPDLASDAGTDTSRFWAADVSDYSSFSGPALDLGDILESSVLRSRNASAEQESLSVGPDPVQEWCAQEHRSTWMFSPGCRQFSVPLTPVYGPLLFHHSQSWDDPRVAQYAHFSAASMTRWEQADFALTLQDAKAPQGLEKTVSDKSNSKVRAKGRPGRTSTKTNTVPVGL